MAGFASESRRLSARSGGIYPEETTMFYDRMNAEGDEQQEQGEQPAAPVE